VAGSIALDLICDYRSNPSDPLSPKLQTSNPASIQQSVGGVGYNVALAAHRANPNIRVKLCSLIGDDM